MRTLIRLAAVGLLMSIALPASAQYPTCPIRGAGAGADGEQHPHPAAHGVQRPPGTRLHVDLGAVTLLLRYVRHRTEAPAPLV